ncbi:hypothetical protein [Micromonospora coerulea]|uniref:hypothetical protein n=1 Tax=Micromonospora coerulea TaxID=47856 RepID=UPI00190789A6|nr:hypothetical protein [Micromonospora veneta]
MHAVLRVALADAERMDLVARNVAKAAKPPALGRAERRALTPGEAKTLLSVLSGDRPEIGASTPRQPGCLVSGPA